MNARLLLIASAPVLCATLGLVLSRDRPAADPAQRFAALVDSLLPAMERLSGLEAERPVRVAMQSPAEVRAYVERRMEEQMPAAEIAGVHDAYAMLGLVPDTLDLRALLFELYAEQIAGYYDPQRKTLYVVQGSPAALETVLAHELVHALQDQHTNLDSLISRRRGNDRQSAAQAAVEGHATLAMLAFSAEAATGRTIDPGALPDVAQQIRPAFDAGNQYPVLTRAPRIIRETLLFPYADGAGFVQALWRGRTPGAPPPAPLGPLLPQSTEQVLHVADHFIAGRDEPTELRFESVDGWRTVYENTLGELETGLFLTEHTGPLPDAARGWDGDRYALLESPAGERVLIWTTIWDDDDSAAGFAARLATIAAAGGLPGTLRFERFTMEERPAVRVAIGGPSAGAAPVPGVHCADEAGARVTCPR